MPTVQELVVEVHPDGAEETQEALDDTAAGFEDATDEIGEGADELEGFSQRWKGAVGVALSALAAGTAGLLAQIPVIGESFDRLAGILDGFIFQLDKELRPSLRSFNKDLAEVEAAVFSAEGPIDAFVAAVTGIGAAFQDIVAKAISDDLRDITEALTGMRPPKELTDFLADLLTLDINDAVSALSDPDFQEAVDSWFSTLRQRVVSVDWGEAVTSIGDNITDELTQAVEWGKGAVDGLITGIQNRVGALEEAARTLPDTVEDGLGVLVSSARAAGGGAVDALIDGISDRMAPLISRANDITENIETTITDWDPIEWGKSVIDGIIDGFQARLAALKDAASDVAQAIRDRMPGSPAETGPLADLDQVGPGMVETVATGMERSAPRAGRAAETVAANADPRGEGTGGGGDPRIELFLDGRAASRATSRYRDDGISRLGRFE